MARYTITTSESKAAIILKYLRELGGVKVKKVEDTEETEIVLHDWHKKILDERLKSVEEHPELLIDWKTMEKNIRQKYGF